MRFLSVVHGADARTELFGPLVAAAGHQLEEWSFEGATQPPHPVESYDAVFVFGGSMHPDQEERHAWMKDELAWLAELLERGVPTLGICLGSQLLARAAGSWVAPLAEAEVGWYDVELTGAGRADSVLSALPERFGAMQWHSYHHGLPDGAVALASNPSALQAFRLGEACWGVQFHPEVTEPQLERWIAEDGAEYEPERLRSETRVRIGGWNELGRRLCRAFVAAADGLAARAA